MWGEDSELNVTSRSQALRAARPHPFAIPADRLSAILEPATAGPSGAPTSPAATPAPSARVALFLPSLPKSPLDSPELIRVRPRAARKFDPALVRWSVPAAPVDPTRLPDLLTAELPDVRLGPAVHYLASMAEFAADLSERGRAIPTLEPAASSQVDDAAPSSPNWRAHWRAALQGPDLIAFQGFVTAMPPVLRAEALTDRESEAATPADVLSRALDCLVDGAVRERLRARRMHLAGALPPRRGRRPARLPASEAWLAALTTDTGLFAANDSEAQALRRSLAGWDGLGAGPAGPAQLLFRLVEPQREPVDDPNSEERDDPETTETDDFDSDGLVRHDPDPHGPGEDGPVQGAVAAGDSALTAPNPSAPVADGSAPPDPT
ncbi:MAG: hypothetical protein LBJ08_02070, partial [Bifidobacteriaceae bacterium]|nr:hypothetical protein [Bifidobacteriaceae bacterium]